jgi:hypothetical protein
MTYEIARPPLGGRKSDLLWRYLARRKGVFLRIIGCSSGGPARFALLWRRAARYAAKRGGRTLGAVRAALESVISPPMASALCRPQKTPAHSRGSGRKCLTGSRFTARMPSVLVRVMPPKPPP